MWPGSSGVVFTNKTDNSVTQVTAEAMLRAILWHNDDGAPRYLQLFNAISGDIAVGTTTPLMVIQIGADTTDEFEFGDAKFSTAISYAVTTEATGSTAGTSSWVGVMYV